MREVAAAPGAAPAGAGGPLREILHYDPGDTSDGDLYHRPNVNGVPLRSAVERLWEAAQRRIVSQISARIMERATIVRIRRVPGIMSASNVEMMHDRSPADRRSRSGLA